MAFWSLVGVIGGLLAGGDMGLWLGLWGCEAIRGDFGA